MEWYDHNRDEKTQEHFDELFRTSVNEAIDMGNLTEFRDLIISGGEDCGLGFEQLKKAFMRDNVEMVVSVWGVYDGDSPSIQQCNELHGICRTNYSLNKTNLSSALCDSKVSDYKEIHEYIFWESVNQDIPESDKQTFEDDKGGTATIMKLAKLWEMKDNSLRS